MQAKSDTQFTRDNLTKAMRWEIADIMAEEILPIVNSNTQKAVPKKSFYGSYIKRFIDIVISLAALIITFPINMIIAVITFFDVGKPLFFLTERTGKNGNVFRMIKFRNMTNEKDETGELLPPSQRITKWGRFVRKTSLDELLNFWSVLKGDMSIIGPRPLPPEYLHRYNNRHVMRLAVRPGLECPSYKKTDHAHTWQEQFENDVWYVENLSLKTDLIMFFRLVQTVFDTKATRARGIVERRAFMGYTKNGEAIALADIPEEYISRIKEKTKMYDKKGEC